MTLHAKVLPSSALAQTHIPSNSHGKQGQGEPRGKGWAASGFLEDCGQAGETGLGQWGQMNRIEASCGCETVQALGRSVGGDF
jgi:hypothetical protein